MNPIYDPFKFIKKVELLTIAVVASFITMKFLNSIYENLYDPIIDLVVKSDNCEKYYLKVGSYYVQFGAIVKEFIKWFLLILILMLIHNVFVKYYAEKKN